MNKNRLTFKFKITIWYVGFMVLLLSVTLYIIYSMSALSSMNQTDKLLLDSINQTKEYIHYDDGLFDFDENITDMSDLVTILIYDQYGNILFGNPPRLFVIDMPFKVGLNSISLPNNNKYLFRDSDYKVENAPFKLVIRAISTYTNVNMTLHSFLIASSILGPIGILIAIFGGYQLMNAIFRPIESISKTAVEITKENDLSLRIADNKKNDELSQLIETINHMLEKVELSFDRERQFTNDISHELRTPLTSILLDIELLQHEKEYNQETINRLHQQIEWMTHLINSMSLSTQQIQLENFEIIDLKDFILKIAQEYHDNVYVLISDNNFIETDVFLLKRIVTNLLNNAFQYGASQVEITWNKSNQLIIEDNGVGIEKDNLPKIWDRFYQLDTTRNNSNSAGLGLYFVKQAVDALGWDIHVESQINVYTRFIITIKNKF